MIDRVFKNWISSALGLGILITCFAMVFTEKATLDQVGLFLPVVIYLFWKKDKKKRICPEK